MDEIPLLDLKKQFTTIKEEIKEAVNKVLSSGRYILGPNVEALEEEIARYCGVSFAVGVASGTDALRLSLIALGIGEGDEVITTPFSFIATTQAIIQTGATPVFVDIDEKTFNLDVKQVESSITERTRAILPVHLFGHSVDMKPLLEIARMYNLFVIEDAAQSFGSEYNYPSPEGATEWRKVGSMGDAGCFSFFPTKNLGGFGDGGMVITNQKEIARKVSLLRVHGGNSFDYSYDMMGYNSRLDELQAAILRVKLKYVDKWIKMRKGKASLYNKLLAGLPVETPHCEPYAKHTFCVYTIKTPQRDNLKRYLDIHRVSTKIYYPIPLHFQRVYDKQNFYQVKLPNAEKVCQEVLSLPLYPELEEEKIIYVVKRIQDFFKEFER